MNDFKAVEGDRQLGLQSLPVMFGVQTAAWICVLMIDIFQGGMAAYLIAIHKNLYAVLLIFLNYSAKLHSKTCISYVIRWKMT